MSEELQKQYYLIKFKILQETYYVIWYTDDIDGFLLDKDGMLKSFPTKEEAMAFAREEGLLINTKKDEFLLSSAILRKKNIRKINCSLFLNYWNLFSDIAHSINCKFIGDSREEHIRHIYEKLFYGCNILLKENEEPYRPKWSKKEKCLIASVMKMGLKFYRKVCTGTDVGNIPGCFWNGTFVVLWNRKADYYAQKAEMGMIFIV